MFVSPFVGRLDDIDRTGMELIKQIADIFKIHGIGTEIIVASMRSPIHVTDAALTGSHRAPILYKVIEQMLVHPPTTSGIEKFLDDWNNNEKKLI